MRLADTRGRGQRYFYTAEELGRMTDEQLREIRHCELCLESYDCCGCRMKLPRRRAAEASNQERDPASEPNDG